MATARGGCSFDELVCSNAPNYVCDRSCLVDLTPTTSISEAAEKLKLDLDNNVFSKLHKNGTNITKFYIGKTRIKEKKEGYQFDHMNPETWPTEGISRVWQRHKTKDYGKNGFIVISAVTRDCVVAWEGVHDEGFFNGSAVFQLVMSLRKYYQNKNDKRLVNNRINITKPDCDTWYAIFLAFSFGREKEPSRNTESIYPPNRPDLKYILTWTGVFSVFIAVFGSVFTGIGCAISMGISSGIETDIGLGASCAIGGTFGAPVGIVIGIILSLLLFCCFVQCQKRNTDCS